MFLPFIISSDNMQPVSSEEADVEEAVVPEGEEADVSEPADGKKLVYLTLYPSIYHTIMIL